MLQTLGNNNIRIVHIELSDTAETTRKLSCQTDPIRIYLESGRKYPGHEILAVLHCRSTMLNISLKGSSHDVESST